MYLPVILSMALVTWAANIQASPVSIRSSARHPPQLLEDPDKAFARRAQDVHAVLARAEDDDEELSMSGVIERDFDIVSPPPKVLPPRSDDAHNGDFHAVSPPPKVIPRSGEEFSMSGVLPPPRKIILSRADGITSVGDFDPVSPPPKTRPSQPKISRRQNIWTLGFIGNLINKFTGKSPTNPTSAQSGSGSGGLTPYEQNGPSKYGTPEMETLPKYYGGGSETPWGSVTTTNANPYKSCPQTGATRSYDFTVAGCDIRPDGVETKKAVCVNGQFPGPLIEANYGDTIQVKVTNKLHDEGTSMHWHGFLQTGTNQMDGVPGVAQCAIAPNATMIYTFRAELYGTAWYHTHYSAQYAGGAVGPMVIYGPTNKDADVDIGPVMLSDWYRNDYMTNIRGLMRPVSEGGPINPLTNSNLINGKMRFPCAKTNLPCETAAYSTFKFTSGKNHLLRLVNSGSNAVQKFAIDGHTMQVISNDFMPVEPYNTSMITLGVGQRADVIVYGSGKSTDKVWMRSNIVACSVNDGQLTEALGVIYYQDADTRSLPTEGFNEGPAADTSPRWCGNDPLAVTIPSFPLKASEPAVTKYLDIRMKNNSTHMLLNFGDHSFRANFNDPILSRALIGLVNNFEPARNVWNVGPAKTMRAVISNYDPTPHPIHLHGHNMQILNSGFGPADEKTIVRPDNPQRRDVMIMPPGTEARPSFLVIQWDADNPGVWPLHCHFNWHSALGLAINVLETPASIAKVMGRVASGQMSEICKSWNAFTKSNGPLLSGIDSGM